MVARKCARADQRPGAEIDFLLILGFLDRQGAQQSFPLPFRAFVARQTTGWRITTVQALIG